MLLLLMGVSQSIAMYGLVYSSQFAPPTTVALLRYIAVLYFFLVDILLFKQDFTYGQLLGAFLMLAVNLASSLIKIRAERNQVKTNEIEI
jgi:drug/metabolite transporter (DMT)-like permease